MKQFTHILSAGLALFAILFGSGNIVFPLVLGRDTGSMVWFAIIGLSITAIFVPLLGLVSTMLVDGEYKRLLRLLGPTAAHLITLVCFLLIGPFGVIPRCIAIAHSAVAWYVPSVTLSIFTATSVVFMYLLTAKQTKVIDIIGRFLGPIKLTLLLSIIVFGLYYSLTPPTVSISAHQSMYNGVIEGLWTMDLLGTIFFAGLILNNIKKYIRISNGKELGIISLKVGLIASFLLGLAYAGFCVVAAMYGPHLGVIETSQILTAIAALVLGPKAGLLANATVAISCLTTAVALTTLFTQWLKEDILRNSLSYQKTLLITLGITAVMSHLGFDAIMNLIAPIVSAFYPALIVLAVVNILHQIWGFQYVKLPVFATFAVTLGLTYWDLVTKCFTLYRG